MNHTSAEQTEQNEHERLKLLTRLKELDTPKNSRRPRSDKGQTHTVTKQRKQRSDKGQTHTVTKQRSDKGQTHTVTKQRSDKGRPHVMTKIVRADVNRPHEYANKTSAFYYQQFQKALSGTTLKNEWGEVVGEGATRDCNGIFDLRVTHKWKMVTKRDGTTYKSKIKLSKPLEQYRWDWLFARAREGDPSVLCKTYHLKPDEWDMWTFSEWCSAYLQLSNGWELTTDIPYFDDAGQPIRYDNSIINNYFNMCD